MWSRPRWRNWPRWRTSSASKRATLALLAKVENIAGVKEASGNISQMASILQVVPPEFVVLSGDDAITLPLIAMGGRGLISVASNEIPSEMTKLVHSCLTGDFVLARALQRQYLPLMEVNFIESNPIPVKSAMALMGLLEPVYRLPMVPPKPENLEKIRNVLTHLGLLARSVPVAH